MLGGNMFHVVVEIVRQLAVFKQQLSDDHCGGVTVKQQRVNDDRCQTAAAGSTDFDRDAARTLDLTIPSCG